MLNRLRKPSLNRKILLYICMLTTLSMVIISITVNILFLSILTNNEIEFNVKASNDTKKQFEFLLKLVDNTSTLLCSNKDVIDQLEQNQYDHSSSNATTNYKINSLLKNAISIQEYIKAIYIIGVNGQFYSSDWSISNDTIVQKYQIPHSDSKMNPMGYNLYTDENTVSYVRPIIRYASEPSLGVIVVDLDINYLSEMFTISSIQNDEKVLVLNQDGETLFSFPYLTNMEQVIQTNPQLLSHDALSYKTTVFGEQCIIVSNTIDYSDWKIIRIISTAKIDKNIKEIAAIILLVSAFAIIISSGVSFVLSLRITRPILKLNEKMNLVQQGELSLSNLKVEVNSDDELGQLNKTFNFMVEKINYLIEQSILEQKMKSDMEFQILQAQINPHFLYNTLGTVKWLANIQNIDSISNITTALINLLKYNISCNDVIVPIMDELNSVRNYIEIQKYKCSDFFTVEYHIDDDTKDCKVIRFTLQPIIENAIYHGFDCFRESGIIKITTGIIKEKLVIKICDNGEGIDATSLQKVLEIENKKFNSIGLHNIADRIKLYFGEDYGLSFESKKGIGTTVTLTLPIIKESN